MTHPTTDPAQNLDQCRRSKNTENAKRSTSAQRYPTHQLRQQGYDSLLIFLTTLLIVTEANVSSLVRPSGPGNVDAKVDEDEVEEDAPTRLRLQLLMFSLVNQTFLMALLFFLHGRLDQQKMLRSGNSKLLGTTDWHFSTSCSRILPAIACKLLHRQLEVTWPTNSSTSGLMKSSSISPIVFFPVLLSSFDLAVWHLLRKLGAARAAAYLEQFQVDRKKIIPVYWLIYIEMDIFLRALFPSDIMSISAFLLTDIPQYFFAYVWGRLSVTTSDVHIFAIIPPHTMPIISMAISVLFSNLALLDLLSMAVPGIANGHLITESVQAALRRIGGGSSPHSLMYGVWKGLSFASIGPSLISTFIENSHQDVSVKIPGVGRRPLKRYAYATFIFYIPLGQLLQIGIDTLRIRALEILDVLPLLQSCGISDVPCVAFVFRGSLHAVIAWTIGFLVVEYVPYASRML